MKLKPLDLSYPGHMFVFPKYQGFLPMIDHIEVNSNFFFPRTYQLWNVLASSSFQNTTACSLSNFKSINSSSSPLLSVSLSSFVGSLCDKPRAFPLHGTLNKNHVFEQRR